MTKIKLAAFIVLLAVTTNTCLAAEDLTKWKYQAQVTIQDTNNNYGGLTITPEIYNAAKPDLGDIRLIGSDGKGVPYLVIKPKDSTATVTFNPKTINYTTNADKQTLVTLDFEKQIVKNSIEVVTEGSNFRRAVKVEGSNDNIEFFTLIEQAFVFAIGDKYNSRFSKIDLPPNDFRYLRVTVAPMPPEDKSPTIKEVQVFDTKQKLAERMPVKLAQLKHDEDEEHHLSIYEYDLGFGNLPVSEITLDVGGEFYRYITVEGRDAATQKVRIESEDNTPRFKEVEVNWQNITSGAIYRYNKADGEKCQNLVLRIPFSAKVHKLPKVTIQNYDNAPLKVNSVAASMIPAKLIFPRGTSPAITLYVGAESAFTPKYDLEYTLKNPDQIKTSPAQLSSLADNPLFGKNAETIPWTEKHKTLLLIALGAVVLVLGGFILKSFKSIQSTQK
jgi:hypothetical protein